MNLIYQCVSTGWPPGIGDPTTLGWVTVTAYFVTAFLSACALRFKGHEQALRREYRLFWILAIIAFVCLGINKQLDLQSLATALARCMAKTEGWYESRREYQLLFIAVILGGGALALVVTARYFQKIIDLVWLACAGLAFLVVFVGIRAMSFHHVDMLIGSQLLGMRVNGVLELSGISLVAINATRLSFRRS